MLRYPTIERLREVLDYDPKTGKFYWKIRTAYCTKIGAEAGSVGGNGYVKIQIDGVVCQAHILAWMYVYGRRARLDHRDLDKTNNRITNLRKCTPTQNNANSPKRAGTSSVFKGVTWNKKVGRWQASIKMNGKNTHLGIFVVEAEAGAAYIAAANKKFGQFARAA